MAAVAVEALLSDTYDGATHTLTGPELLSVPDQVACLSEELGEVIGTVDLSPAVAGEQMLGAGLDPSVVAVAVRGMESVRAGGNAVLTGEVESILGRPARDFRSWVREHRDAFRR